MFELKLVDFFCGGYWVYYIVDIKFIILIMIIINNVDLFLVSVIKCTYGFYVGISIWYIISGNELGKY